MSQIEVSKIAGHAYVAPPVGNASVSKLVMYVWATPGDGGGEDTSNRQGQVHTQIIRRG